MISRSSSFSISCVVGTNLAVNTKKLLKYARPGIVRPGTPSCAAAKHLQFLQAQCLNCIGEGFRGVFPRPPFLLMKNDAIHVTAPNSHHWRAAGLTFQGNKPKCFLNARMNEKIGRAIKAREIGRVSAIPDPRDRAVSTVL